MNGGLYGYGTGHETDDLRGWPLGRASYRLAGRAAAYTQGFYGGRGGQGTQGGGKYGALDCHSSQGGGSYGALDAHAAQGGGSVSGVPLYLSGTNQYSTLQSTFLKVAALPASDMMILDLNGGSTGYMRVKLTSAGHLIGETLFYGATHSVDTTIVVSPGQWYWVSHAIFGVGGAWYEYIQAWDSSGATPGTQTHQTLGSQADIAATATLGIGVPLSAAYLPFPNAVGYEWSKAQGQHSTTIDLGPIAPPTADSSPTGLDYLYLCRDAVGSASSLVDSTSNARTLGAGTQGLLVTLDGPYA